MKKNTTIPSDKEALINKWRSSGKGMQAFCKESAIPYYLLQYWHRKQSGKLSAVQPGFIKIQPQIKNEASHEKMSEVIYSNGNRIVFYSNRKITELKQLAH